MTDAFEIQQAFRVLEKHAKYSAEVLEDLKARVLSGGPQAPDPRRDEYVQRLHCNLAEARSRANSLSHMVADRGRECRKLRGELEKMTAARDAASELRAAGEARFGRVREMLDAVRLRADSLSASLADCERERRKAARERDEEKARADRLTSLAADRGREFVSMREQHDKARAELADALGALEQERERRRTYQSELSYVMREIERLKASEAASAERERKLTDALRVGGERCAAAERARKVLIDQVAALHGWNPSDGAVRAAHGMLIHSGQSAIRSALRAAFVHDHFEAGEPRT